jgi:ABC-type multidrug transport system fused ATPase/permease subunit
MEQPPEQSKATHKEYHDPNGQGPRGPFRKLDWALWANSAWSVLGLLIASFLATPVFEFCSTRQKIALSISGAIVAFGTVVLFFWQSIRLHRQGRTSAQLEQQAEEERNRLTQQIGHLETALSLAREKLAEYEPRFLTGEQRERIAADLRTFSGQPAIVRCRQYDTEGMRFAEHFVATLKAAGWNVPGYQTHTDYSDFENVAVAISSQDHATSRIPPAAAVLITSLKNAGVSTLNGFILLPDIQAGSVGLCINIKPVAKS